MPERFLPVGRFSRLVGVSPDLLRAWERRYGVPRPARTAGGVRIYSRADEELVRTMQHALARGLPAAEAARLATDSSAPGLAEPGVSGDLGALKGRLDDALMHFREARAQGELDRLFGAYSVDAALSEVILPSLRLIGDQWASGQAGVGHEHFASNVIHGRLLSLTRKWDQGHGPRALLACPSGELHTLGLLCFGLALRTHGWRITYLGADTPIHVLAEVADAVEPEQIVLSSVRTEPYVQVGSELAALAQRRSVALGGAGALGAVTASLGAKPLTGDPVTEAAGIDRARAARS